MRKRLEYLFIFDSACRAYRFALAAADTLAGAFQFLRDPYSHGADLLALAAADAGRAVQRQTVQGEAVEQAVEGPQRAQVAAKAPRDEERAG